MAENKQPTIPFRTGDVVKKVKKTSWFCNVGEEHIISKVSRQGTDWEYGTNRSAWHDHESFELVREADVESLRQLVKDLDEDEFD